MDSPLISLTVSPTLSGGGRYVCVRREGWSEGGTPALIRAAPLEDSQWLLLTPQHLTPSFKGLGGLNDTNKLISLVSCSNNYFF